MKYYRVKLLNSDWCAMFLSESAEENEFERHLVQYTGEQLDKSLGLPRFMLMSERTWSSSSVWDDEGTADDFGMRLHDPDDGKEFAPILKWGWIGSVEYAIEDIPQYLNYMVVSEQIKLVLEKHHLPDHAYYPISIEHEVTGEKRIYYVMQLFMDMETYAKYCDLSMMEFVIIDSRDNVLKTYNRGIFSDYEEYLTTVSEQLASFRKAGTGCRIITEYYCLLEDYDLLFTPYKMIMSERLRDALQNEVGIEYATTESHVPIANGLKTEAEFQAFLQTFPKEG